MKLDNSSLRKRLLRMSIWGTLVVLLLQTVLFTYYSARLFNEQARTQNENSLTNLQSEVYNYIKNMETNLIGTYNEKSLIRDLENGLSIEMLQEKYYEEASFLQNENYQNSDSVVALYLYDKKSELISSYQKSMTKKYKYPEDIYQADYNVNEKEVTDYIASDQTIMKISSYYNANREENMVRFIMKLFKNSDTKKVIGYVVCDVDGNNLEGILKKYITTDDMYLWLQPQGDRSVMSVGRLPGITSEEYKQLLQEIRIGTSVKNQSSCGGCTLYQKDQTKYALTAYVLEPQRAISESLRAMMNVLLIIVVIMIFLVAAISSGISVSISKPLENMIQVVNRIRAGESGLRVGDPKREDEIGNLGRNIDELLDEIHELMEEKYKTQMLLDRAEYLTLQAQINPHFLYNTLDTISSIASVQNCQTVSYLSQSLASIFRYTLNMSNPLATISEEMSHVKNYVYVMDVRNRSSIQYDFQIEKDTMEDLLPRISLEPLVENALSHGLKNSRRKDKKVWIKTERKNEEVWVTVADNGIGCNGQEVQKRLDQENNLMGDDGQSIGLLNINNRLKKMFGKEYGILIESEPNVETRVMIHVRRISQEEAAIWKKEYTKF